MSASLRRPTLPSVPISEDEFWLHGANFHVNEAKEWTSVVDRRLRTGDLAGALEAIDLWASHTETARANLVRYAVASHRMSEQTVAEACAVTVGRIRTMVKDGAHRWAEVDPQAKAATS